MMIEVMHCFDVSVKKIIIISIFQNYNNDKIFFY